MTAPEKFASKAEADEYMESHRGKRRHEPGEPHDYDLRCRTCGERGTVRLLIDPPAAPALEGARHPEAGETGAGEA